MQTRSSLLLVGALLLGGGAVSCSSAESVEAPALNPVLIDRYLAEAHARGQFNGNVLVVEGGEPVYRGAFGIRDPESGAPLQLDSVFRLASVSKQFTAMGVLILKERGALTLDQDVRDFVPELPYEGITLRHLLHHVSGLPDYTWLMHEHWKPELDLEDPARMIEGNEDVLEVLARHAPEPNFAPGENWEYSNTGYMLLATVVARASGMPFEDFLAHAIFEPAGMTSTVVYDYVPGPDPRMPKRAFSFWRRLDGSLALRDHHFLNGAQGDGGIFSTLDDLARWDRILYTEALVSRATLEEAFRPAVLSNGEATDYGFGWGLGESFTGKRSVRHSGGWVGFSTYIERAIEEDRCLIFLANGELPGGSFGSLLEGLDRLMHGQPAELPKLSIYQHLGRIVLSEGVERARAEYARIVAEQPDDFVLEEGELNNLGYRLLGQDATAEAVAIFGLNLQAYPESANCHDSLADGLREQGRLEEARELYRRALELDPDFVEAEAKLAEVEAQLAG